MTSRPHVPSGNRFIDLDMEVDPPPDYKKSRKRKPNSSPPLPIYTIPTQSLSDDPKFIVISPTDDSKPLTSFSVFALKKAIDGISTSYEQITQLRDGSLLVLVKSRKIADLFISKKALSNLCPISVSLQNQLNSSKGTVNAPRKRNIE